MKLATISTILFVRDIARNEEKDPRLGERMSTASKGIGML
jgi:hypothetical protein